MSGNELFFALNDLFNDDDRKQIVSHLLKHPAIWNFLENGSNFELIKEKLGNRAIQWTPLNILLSAHDLDPLTKVNHTIENIQVPEQLPVQDYTQKFNTDDFKSYLPLLQWIMGKYHLEKNWNFIHELLELKVDSAISIVEKFGTMISILFEIDPENICMLSDFINIFPGEHASTIAAKIIFISAINDQSFRDMWNLFKTKVNSEARVEVLKQLKRLGQNDLVIEMSLEELKGDTFEESQSIVTNYPINFVEELKNISNIKNRVELLNLAAKKEQADNLLENAEFRVTRILTSLSSLRIDRKTGNEQNSAISFRNRKTSQERTLPGDLPAEPQQLFQIDDQVKLFNSIYQSDHKSARQLALSIIQTLNNYRDKNIIGTWVDQNGVNEIVLLIEKFVDLGIIYESRDLAITIYRYHPQNFLIIKFLAEINYQFGDKYNSVYFYGLADSLIGLQDDERARFAEALLTNDYWKQAAKIYADLSKSNSKYFASQLFCLFQSGQIEDASKLCDEIKKDDIQDASYHVLSGLISDKLGRHIDAEEEIKNAFLENYPDETTCVQAAEYFASKSDVNTAIDILRIGIQHRKEISMGVIKLVEILSKMKRLEEKEELIKEYFSNLSITDESVFRYLIKLEESVFDPKLIEKVIITNKKKWPLMPEIIANQAHECLEKKYFDKSRKLLSPLITRERKEIDWVADYCLSVIKCNHQEFPLGIQQDHISKLKDSECREIKELIHEYKNTLPFKLFFLIIFSDNPINDLLNTENDNELNSLNDYWQINAYIGKQYFDSGQYDRSIFYLEKASTNNNNHLMIQQYLITAYQKLNLWHETQIQVIDFYSKMRNNLVLIKQVFDGIRDQTTIIDILNKLDLIDPENNYLKVMQAYVQIKNGNFLVAQEHLHDLVNKQYLGTDLLLFIAQLLIESGEKKLPIWITNKILSMNHIDDKEYFATAILLFQLNEVDKAIRCISHFPSRDCSSQILKVWLQIQSGTRSNYGDLINDIIQIDIPDDEEYFENTFINLVNLPSDLRILLRNPIQLIYKIIQILLEENSLKEAIQGVERCLEKYPTDEKLIALWLEMQLISNGIQIPGIDARISTYLEECENTGKYELLCILSEIDLLKNYDVRIAQRLTQLADIDKEKPRVMLIQARLLAKTGKKDQALEMINDIYEEYKNNQSVPDNINILFSYSNPLLTIGFLDAVFEMKEYARAVEICLSLFDKEILTDHIQDIFLYSLAACLEINELLSIVGIKNHLISLDEQNIGRILEKISSLEENRGNTKNDLILHYCHFLINATEPRNKAYIESHISNLEPKSFIYAAHLLEKPYSVEEFIDSHDPDIYFYLAVLNYERHPHIALLCLSELIKGNSSKAEYYALLALLKHKEGSIEEAFSAINLALDIKDDEPLLLKRAGELSEVMGDDFSAIEYYERSIRHNPDVQIEDKLIQLFIKTRKYSSLKFIEERISGHIHDDHILLFLADSFLAKGDFRRATYYSDLLLNNKNIKDAMIIRSRIAYMLKKYEKADEILSQIAESFHNDIEFVLQKANIIAVKVNIQSAIDYLDEVKPYPSIEDERIVILKSKLIEMQDGLEASLIYLESINAKNQSTNNLLAISEILLRLGQLEKAEQLLEKEIENSPVNPDILAQMAYIARDKGDLDRAVDLLTNSILNNPYTTKYYIELANLYILRREIKKGIEILKEAQKINHDDKEIIKAMHAIINRGSLFEQINTYELESVGLE